MTQASASTQIPPDSTSRRRGPDTAERILDAAEDYFGRKGYAGTTLRDVADQVGIRIPSLYNHFPNKAALYSAVLERGISPVLTLLSRSIQGDETEPAEAMDPKTTVRAVMHWLALRPSLPRLIQYELLAGGEQLAPLLSDWLQPAMSQGLVMMKTTPGVERWRSNEIPFLVMALFNIVVGHFTTSALTESLSPTPPLSEAGIEAAADLYGQLVEALLQEAPTSPKPNE